MKEDLRFGIWYGLLFLLISHLGVVYPQTEEDKKEVFLKLDSSLFVFSDTEYIQKPIIISGKSNLPENTVIKTNIYAKLTSVDSIRFELIETLWIIIKEDGCFQISLKPLGTLPFLCEGWKIEVNLPDSETSTSLYFSVVSGLISKNRQKNIVFFSQVISELYRLDKELKDFMSDTNSIKEGKTGWERIIKQLLGTFQTPSEALASAIEKWLQWEVKYVKKLDSLFEKVYSRYDATSMLLLQEKVSYFVALLFEEYAMYRSGLLGDYKKTSYPPSAILSNSEENKNKLILALEQNVLSKIFQDILAIMEFLDKAYNNEITDLSSQREKKEELLQFCSRIKNEIENYYQIGLFKKSSFSKQSRDLIEIIDMLSIILDKLFPSETQTNLAEAISKLSQKEQTEIQNLIMLFNNKVVSFSASLY
jgi:hypothetical protein